jgi:hypothetical protein
MSRPFILVTDIRTLCESQAVACSGHRQPVTIRNRTEVGSRRLRSMSRQA